MLDRFYMPFLALAALAVIALASVWPQGLGDRSPPPFGHEPKMRDPGMQAALQRAGAAAQRRVDEAREAVRQMQSERSPSPPPSSPPPAQ